MALVGHENRRPPRFEPIGSHAYAFRVRQSLAQWLKAQEQWIQERACHSCCPSPRVIKHSRDEIYFTTEPHQYSLEGSVIKGGYCNGIILANRWKTRKAISIRDATDYFSEGFRVRELENSSSSPSCSNCSQFVSVGGYIPSSLMSRTALSSFHSLYLVIGITSCLFLTNVRFSSLNLDFSFAIQSRLPFLPECSQLLLFILTALFNTRGPLVILSFPLSESQP